VTKDQFTDRLLQMLETERGSVSVYETALRCVVNEDLAEVEEQEDEHLYHGMGWCRELRCESSGLPAVLPPPEEEKDVKTAIGAARAKKARREML
jgi:hypothetical protein